MSEDTELRLSPEGATFIDAGADSLVYRIGNEVVKVYKEQGVERIRLYKQITNQSAEWLRIQAKVYQIIIRGQTYNYTVSVNPITAVGEHPSFPGKVTSTAEYISGSRLTDPFPPEVPFKNREIADPVSIQLEALSDQLNKQMGVKGILIVEPNVKFKYNSEIPEISLTVTDISSHIWSLSLPA